jgi:hypothetical protein
MALQAVVLLSTPITTLLAMVVSFANVGMVKSLPEFG